VTGTEVVVRSATPADADVVGTLTEGVYRAGGFTDDAYATVLRDAAARIAVADVLVAELDGRIVGSLTVAAPGSPFGELATSGEAEVRMLAVVDEARGGGVASLLMDAAESLARERGARAVVLSTEPEMHAAHRLYQRRGYERVPGLDRRIDRFELLAYRLALDA